MTALVTGLTEFSDLGNTRTYVVTSVHTALRPRLVIQRRKVPSGNQVVAEDSISVLYATLDSEGAVLPQKVTMSVNIRRPITGLAQDVTDALVVLRDIVQSTEFTSVVNGQVHLK